MTPAELMRLEDHWQSLGISETSPEAIAIGGGWACYAEPESWQNRAMGLGNDGPVDAAELDRLVSFYRDRDETPRVEVSPHADASLRNGLRERGFGVSDFETVLYRALDEAFEPVWPDGVELVEVGDDAEAIARFVETLNTGFYADQPPKDRSAYVRAGLRVAAHPRVRSFLAVEGGAPVGAASFELAPPLGRLIGASVMPAHRGRGIQSAFIALRCALGREAGCTHAVVQSSPGQGTERNALRAGFAVACTKVTMTA